ncbi:CLUMA_CG004126, isoform A [Clunio marinus]|uniref:CLUMA_CG004126, isoform A n=1 Tax=Clunio marinus TaxID=568069 RepID=A0A1J1HR52_9DIPT|nr:CLUMA_CG004126, isoform A [Clunio marinus]
MELNMNATETLKLKKQNLKRHLELFKEMITKTRSEQSRVKWSKMLKSIEADDTSFREINEIEKEVNFLNLQKKQARRNNFLNVLRKTETSLVPNSNLKDSSDALSNDKNQSMESSSNNQRKFIPLKGNLIHPIRGLNVNKLTISNKRSWSIDSRTEDKTKIIPKFLSTISGQSLLKSPFKIPKVGNQDSNVKTSQNNPTKSNESELKVVNIYETKTDGKSEYAKSFPDYKDLVEDTKKNTKEIDKNSESSSALPLIRVKGPEKLFAQSEWSPDKKPLESPGTSPQDQKSETEGKNLRSKRKEIDNELRRNKELRRLHEDIVKHDMPLNTKRSCTLKRNSGGDDLSMTDDSSQDCQEYRITRKTAADESLTRKSESKSVKEQTSPSTRITRKRAALMETNNHEIEESSMNKKIQKKEESNDIVKNYNLRPCSINIPVVQPEMLKKPIVMKATARKSTSSLLQSELSETKQFFNKTKFPEKEEVEEKEDGDDSIEMKTEPNLKEFKTVWNMGYAISNEDIWYKCFVKHCRISTIQKHKFVDHLDMRHRDITWSGFCHTCEKTILPKKVGNYSLINEFIHMSDAHYSLHNLSIKEPKCPSVKEPCDIDPELMKGIDSILSELLPEDILENSKSNDEKSEKPQIKDPKPPVKSISMTFPTRTSTTTSPSETKSVTISKNIVGRVITLPQNARFIPMGLIKGTKSSSIKPLNIVNKSSAIVYPRMPEASIVKAQHKPNIPVMAEKIGKLEIQRPILIKQNINENKLIVSRNSTSTTLSTGGIKKKNENQDVNYTLEISTPVMASENHEETFDHKPKMTQLPSRPVKTSSAIVEKKVTNDEMKNCSTHPRSISLAIPEVTLNSIVINSQNNFREILCPWLERPTQKAFLTASLMLTSNALAATFKCLGTGCSFYTSSNEVFLQHLGFHMTCTLSDRINFLSCAYCKFTAQKSPEQLIIHIKNEHCFDRFLCSFCFYRSCSDLNVFIHQNTFHKMKKHAIMVTNVEKVRNYPKELERVKKRMTDVVPPIICVFCRNIFYVFKTFLMHLNEHNTTLNTKCTKCGLKTSKGLLLKHLMQCHKFGIYQCVYCRFGTNTVEMIRSHIVNEHGSRLPLYCERSQYKTPPHHNDIYYKPPDSSIESTCLRSVNDYVPPGILHRSSLLLPSLGNIENVGELGNNIVVRSTNDDCDPDSSNRGNRLHITVRPERQTDKTKTIVVRKIGQSTVKPTTSPTKQSNESESYPKKSVGLQIQNVFSLSNDSSPS